MKKLILSLICLSGLLSQAQTFQWLQTPPINYELNPDMIGYVNTIDSSGNIYFAGYKDNHYNYGADMMGDVMYNKYDTTGQLLFSKTFTGNLTIYSMISDNQGNIIVDAAFVNTITIDAMTVTDFNAVHPILLKFDAQGNLLWHFRPNIDGDPASSLRGIATDASNSIYIGCDNYMNSSILRLSPEGIVTMTITQLNVPRITSVGIDTQGNIIVAGSCAEPNATYAGTAFPTTFNYNTYAAKYSSTGACQWVKYVEDITCPEPKIKVNTPDQIYFCSHLYGAYAFGNFTAEGPLSGNNNDFFLAKLNAAGDWQWMREVPGTGAFVTGHRDYLAMDNNGNTYVAGSTSGTINWGNTITSTSQNLGSDAIVIKYNPEGNIQMAVTAGGASQDRVDGVSADASGVFISGMVRGTSNFGTLSSIITGNAAYPFFAKMTNGTLGIPDTKLPVITLYPNPTTNYLNITSQPEPTKASIYNMLGQKIKDIQVQENKAVDVRELAKGIYIIKINNSSIQFIKE